MFALHEEVFVTMHQDQALKALSQALKLEQDGRAFYLKAFEETVDEKGKAMFLSLADDERLHAEMVQRQLHALEGDGHYVLLPDLGAPAIDLNHQIFAPDKLEAKAGVNPSEIDALHVALEAEIASYDLYRAAAQEAEDGPGKEMYTWLSKAELTHFNLLMENYESLAYGGGWV